MRYSEPAPAPSKCSDAGSVTGPLDSWGDVRERREGEMDRQIGSEVGRRERGGRQAGRQRGREGEGEIAIEIVCVCARACVCV